MEKFFSKRKFFASAVGSLPHREVKKSCDFLEDNFRDGIIFWPQLPKRSFKENMYVQFSEKFPGVTVEEEQKRIYVDTEKEDFLKEMEEAYLHGLNDDWQYFAIGEDYASGFFEMLKRIKSKDTEFFKGQIIGPVSFGLTITDQKQQAIIYNAELTEILVKFLSLKTKWQIRKIKEQNPNLKIIIFVDEPYLVSVGSSFTALKKEKIVNDINALIKTIHEEDSWAGVHCCGNTDWSIILETELDILNFDAFNYLDNLLLYSHELKKFLDHQGMLAWGIVPNDQDTLAKINADNLIARIEKGAVKREILRNNVLITPSCGCGTLDEGTAEKVHLLALEVAEKLSKKGY